MVLPRQATAERFIQLISDVQFPATRPARWRIENFLNLLAGFSVLWAVVNGLPFAQKDPGDQYIWFILVWFSDASLFKTGVGWIAHQNNPVPEIEMYIQRQNLWPRRK